MPIALLGWFNIWIKFPPFCKTDIGPFQVTFANKFDEKNTSHVIFLQVL